MHKPVPTPWIAGSLAAGATGAGILAGSRNLENFDVALLGYAVATIVLAFGASARLVTWANGPAARRSLKASWRALVRPGRPEALAGAKAMMSTVLLQRFIAGRSTRRWLAHQALFWGVLLATAMTFPLTFGWIHFRAVEGSASGYWIHVFGVRAGRFDALGVTGWAMFHGLDLAAVLVIGGAAYYLRRRLAERRTNPVGFGRDLAPLLALLSISATGLGLSFSSMFLAGAFYHPIALVHMGTVVLTLIWVPFGKFVHTLQRPAMAGIQLHKADGLEASGLFACRRCGEPVESADFVAGLQGTMGELRLDFPGWIETCPRCKRVARGAEYRSTVKAGF